MSKRKERNKKRNRQTFVNKYNEALNKFGKNHPITRARQKKLIEHDKESAK